MQEVHQFIRLDPFRNNLHIQFVDQINNVCYDLFRFYIQMIVKKAFIQLYHVHIQFLQDRQRRVAKPKIIKRTQKAVLVDIGNHILYHLYLVAIKHCGFSYF